MFGQLSTAISHKETLTGGGDNNNYTIDEDQKYITRKYQDWNLDHRSTPLDNPTLFSLNNVPPSIWYNKIRYNNSDPEDRAYIMSCLEKRNAFYTTSPLKVYKMWRELTLMADNQGSISCDILGSNPDYKNLQELTSSKKWCERNPPFKIVTFDSSAQLYRLHSQFR